MDRVLSFTNLCAPFPGKANSAADILSLMQTDPNLTLQIKTTDRVPIHEIEIETGTKAPNLSLLNNSEFTPFSEDIQPVVDEHFINQLKAHSLYDNFSAKLPNDDPDIHKTGLLFVSLVPQLNLIEDTDFEDILNDLPNLTQPLDLVREQ